MSKTNVEQVLDLYDAELFQQIVHETTPTAAQLAELKEKLKKIVDDYKKNQNDTDLQNATIHIAILFPEYDLGIDVQKMFPKKQDKHMEIGSIDLSKINLLNIDLKLQKLDSDKADKYVKDIMFIADRNVEFEPNVDLNYLNARFGNVDRFALALRSYNNTIRELITSFVSDIQSKKDPGAKERLLLLAEKRKLDSWTLANNDDLLSILTPDDIKKIPLNIHFISRYIIAQTASLNERADYTNFFKKLPLDFIRTNRDEILYALKERSERVYYLQEALLQPKIHETSILELNQDTIKSYVDAFVAGKQQVSQDKENQDNLTEEIIETNQRIYKEIRNQLFVKNVENLQELDIKTLKEFQKLQEANYNPSKKSPNHDFTKLVSLLEDYQIMACYSGESTNPKPILSTYLVKDTDKLYEHISSTKNLKQMLRSFKEAEMSFEDMENLLDILEMFKRNLETKSIGEAINNKFLKNYELIRNSLLKEMEYRKNEELVKLMNPESDVIMDVKACDKVIRKIIDLRKERGAHAHKTINTKDLESFIKKLKGVIKEFAGSASKVSTIKIYKWVSNLFNLLGLKNADKRMVERINKKFSGMIIKSNRNIGSAYQIGADIVKKDVNKVNNRAKKHRKKSI